MRRSTILAFLVGLGLAISLIAENDVGRIVGAVAGAGWGIALVLALHLPQTLFSALGWRALIDESPPPRLGLLYRLRWIREAVNALLPVAQVGGDLVRARLLTWHGSAPKTAVASSVVDLSVEMLTQIVFTLIGVGLLVAGPHADDAPRLAISVAIAGGVIALSFLAAQRLGLFKLVERAIARGVRGGRWAILGDLSGLNEAVIGLYRQPARIWTSGAHHLVSWGLGGLETYAAMMVLGLDATLREAVIIETLGQTVRSFAFLIPGALGVQEGGYLLIGAMFGVSSQNALALSLIRRVRELALGVPGLVLWQRIEGRRPARSTTAEEPIS